MVNHPVAESFLVIAFVGVFWFGCVFCCLGRLFFLFGLWFGVMLRLEKAGNGWFRLVLALIGLERLLKALSPPF
jgi:hypothetical protein